LSARISTNVAIPGAVLRRLRLAAVLAALALVVCTIAASPSLRGSFLRAAGWVLVVDEPAGPADIIVLSLDSGPAGALEAVDLVQAGIAKQVAIFADPLSEEDRELGRRGLPYDDEGTRQISRLKVLGITNVMQVSRVNGSDDEGLVLPAWCDEHQFRTVVFVATKDHSRRLQRVLDRAMKGHPTHVTVHAARYSNFDPDRWWESRLGVRIEIIELEKLLLDVVLHPLSS
jgi:hypothetical protein